MKRLKQSYIVIVLSLVLLCSASGLTAKIRDGEKLVFNIKYGVVNAAQATLQIKSNTLGEVPVWQITSNTKSYPFFDPVFKVRDEITSYWEKETLRSLRFTKRLNEGKYQQFRVVINNYQTNTSTYQSWNFKKQKFRMRDFKIGNQVQDIMSAFYLTRQQKLVVGKPLSINVVTDGKTYKITVLVHKKETIDSIFGPMTCFVIEPKLTEESIFRQSGRILIWVTDDEYKIPLKLTSQISIGAFTAELTSAKNVPYKCP